MNQTLEFTFTTSRGRDTYGYTICTLYVDGEKVSRCNGGGYDMKGTCFGNWLAKAFADRLLTLGEDTFYGLTFHDPDYDPGKAILIKSGKTVEQAEAEGGSLGLDRYQTFYQASSPVSTARHTVPLINGACGFSSVVRIANAIGITLEHIQARSNQDIYIAHVNDVKEEN